MSAEQTPRPAVDVLREGVRWTWCTCDGSWQHTPDHAQHQADALAAEGYPVTAEGLAKHDRVVATRALREAAREVHIEARWAAECRVARRPYTPTERLAMLEQILTDRIAAGEDEADSFANTNASGNNPTPLSQTEPPQEVVE